MMGYNGSKVTNSSFEIVKLISKKRKTKLKVNRHIIPWGLMAIPIEKLATVARDYKNAKWCNCAAKRELTNINTHLLTSHITKHHET